MTIIESIGLLGLTITSLIGAPSSGWTESTYTAPVISDKLYSAGLTAIINTGTSDMTVPSINKVVHMQDLVTGTPSGLSGGDPSWRAPFSDLKENYSSGTTQWPAYTVKVGETLQRMAKKWTEEGTNTFSRTSGSPSTASRTLFRTWDNRPGEIWGTVDL